MQETLRSSIRYHRRTDGNFGLLSISPLLPSKYGTVVFIQELNSTSQKYIISEDSRICNNFPNFVFSCNLISVHS